VALITVVIEIEVDSEEFVAPTPNFEEDPEGFVRGLVQEWILHGLEGEIPKVEWESEGFTMHKLGVVPE
jgi:hypothetical protein